MGGPITSQQQAALAQALAGCSRFFSPYGMHMMNGGIAQHLAAIAGLPVPSNGAGPSPSLPMPLPMPKVPSFTQISLPPRGLMLPAL